MKALIIEDDERISDPIKEVLEHNQFVVSLAHDGSTGLNLASSDHYDLILLDIMLPKLDGLKLCRTLRENGCKSGIIMLTALDQKRNKIDGLDAGADDYLVKPFDIDELLARVRAVTRRNSETREPLLKWRSVVLNTATCEVRNGDTTVTLTPTEFRMLAHFLRNPNRTFSKDELINRLWLPDEAPTDHVVKAHIKGLRKALVQAGVTTSMIETVYGFGYRLAQHAP
ncbi:MAG TPA: response regulator transcription factor [Oculatellaceae cyanobacterium]